MKLLCRAEGYQFIEVRCESLESRQYRVRDFWDWHRHFENFRGRFHSEYEYFENWIVSEGLIEKEQFLGAYYEELNDGDELVAG